jgi:acetyltransferase-like isoleucine patch superfamily enzyme
MRALLLRLRHRSRLSLAPGVRIGRRVRVEVDPGARIVLGPRARIGDGTRLVARAGELRIGAGAVLGERCTIVALAGVEIGDDARLGQRVAIADFEPGADDAETPIRAQPPRAAPVRIGAGAVVDHGASVLAGVTVGERAHVGAHAVVAEDVPAGGSAAGTPAEVGAR